MGKQSFGWNGTVSRFYMPFPRNKSMFAAITGYHSVCRSRGVKPPLSGRISWKFEWQGANNRQGWLHIRSFITEPLATQFSRQCRHPGQRPIWLLISQKWMVDVLAEEANINIIQKMNVSLIFEVLLYLNSYYFGLFAISELGMNAVKYINFSSLHHYSTDFLVLLGVCLIEILRIILASRGNLTEKRK